MASNKKFQFVMSDKLRNTLDKIKEKTGRETYTEVLKDALKTYFWVVQEYEQGRQVLSHPFDKGTVPFNPLLISKQKEKG